MRTSRIQMFFVVIIQAVLCHSAFGGRLFLVPQGTDPAEADATVGVDFPVTVQAGETITIEVYLQDQRASFELIEVTYSCDSVAEFQAGSPIRYVANSAMVDVSRRDFIFAGFPNFPAVDLGQCDPELSCGDRPDDSCPGNSECENAICTITRPRTGGVLFAPRPISLPGETRYFAEISYHVPDDALGTSIIRPVCCINDADCDGLEDEGCETGNTFIGATMQENFSNVDGIELTIDAPLQVVETPAPFSGYVDPRVELNQRDVRQGITSAAMRFSEPIFGSPTGDPVGINNFTISSTGGDTPMITDIAITGLSFPVVSVTLDRAIPLQHWTTIVADLYDADGDAILNEGSLGENGDEPDRIDIAALPGDVDQNGTVEPIDVIEFRRIINKEVLPTQGSIEDFVDTDRNGIVNPVDLFRLRQTLNGIDFASQPWSGESLLAPRP